MEPPIKPDESDCCNSGCTPCILDVYEDQLKKYNKSKEGSALTSGIKTNCLSTTSYTVFRLIDMQKHGETAYLLTFEYVRSMKKNIATENSCIIYKPGQYFLLKAGKENDQFTRAYTPIPIEKNQELQFTTLIKLYDTGKMSRYIREHFTVGLETLWRGPYGDFEISYNHKHMLLIAQGTGIAPIYSIVCKLVENENCYTFIKLFYCCRSCSTIFLRDDLYRLQANWNFSYEIFLSNPTNITEKYNEVVHRFKLDEIVLKNYLVDKFGCVQALISGSENFMKAMKNYTVNSKVEEEKIFLF